jgi:uncharacterized YigZ family protein
LKNKASYYTLSQVSESQFKEKGSKFLGFAFPVSSEEEIKEKLDFLRKKYFDARHHCFAYILGKDKDIYRANDDGEPNHSAGDPILGQIRSHSLTNTLIVVVRYFGGTKLGVGGLIQAYRIAASEAIANNIIIEKEDKKELKLNFNYLEMNQVMKFIKEYNLEISDQKFDNSCEIGLMVPDGIRETVIQTIDDLGGITIVQD